MKRRPDARCERAGPQESANLFIWLLCLVAGVRIFLFLRRISVFQAGRRLDDLDATRFRRCDRFFDTHHAFRLDAKAVRSVVASSYLHVARRLELSL